MVDAVNNVNVINSADTAAVRASAAKAPTAEVEAAQLVKKTAAPISPRLVFDASAGAMVTEFVGKDGEVTTQVPSSAALAYLRAGLNVNGQQDPVESATA